MRGETATFTRIQEARNTSLMQMHEPLNGLTISLGVRIVGSETDCFWFFEKDRSVSSALSQTRAPNPLIDCCAAPQAVLVALLPYRGLHHLASRF